jgi:hypothetical protein
MSSFPLALGDASARPKQYHSRSEGPLPALIDKCVFDVVLENSVQIELPQPKLTIHINTLRATLGWLFVLVLQRWKQHGRNAQVLTVVEDLRQVGRAGRYRLLTFPVVGSSLRCGRVLVVCPSAAMHLL